MQAYRDKAKGEYAYLFFYRSNYLPDKSCLNGPVSASRALPVAAGTKWRQAYPEHGN